MAETPKTGTGSPPKENYLGAESSPNFAPVVEVDSTREDGGDSSYGDA